MIKAGYRYSLLIFISLFFITIYTWGQRPVQSFDPSDFTREDSMALVKMYGTNKEILPRFALPTLIALSYFPELKNTKIRFVFKDAYSPLRTIPNFTGIWRKGNKRSYTVTISDSSVFKLESILLPFMDFNARIGVIGHELSHVADFSGMSLLQLAGSGIGHISTRYIDRFEYRTDGICVDHGLGYQLLEWSRFVRKTLHTKNWEGSDNINEPVMKRERYMNPSTILLKIQQSDIYKK
jgi:hypothetical protein